MRIAMKTANYRMILTAALAAILPIAFSSCATHLTDINEVEMTYEITDGGSENGKNGYESNTEEDSSGTETLASGNSAIGDSESQDTPRNLDEIVPNTRSETFTIDKAKAMLSVEPGIGKVTLNNVAGKSVFVISQNNTAKTISTKSAMTVASLALSGRAAIKKQSLSGDTPAELEKKNGFSDVTIKGISKNDIKFDTASSNSARAATYNKGTTPHVGSQKSIFIDANPSITKFKKVNAKLEVEGTYCNIWSVVNDSILDNASCRNIATTFDSYYMQMRAIFGYESDKIYIYNNGFQLDSMKNHTNTGTKVNIVICTLSSPSMIGYFHSKDYYATEEELIALTGKTYSESSGPKYSNGGKYLYLNYKYASGISANYPGGGDAETKALAMSTILHEFQHMINFSVKNMNGLTPSIWYNEMLSMLAEDIFAVPLGTGKKAPSVMRMSSFYNNYYRGGLTEFNTAYSYAIVYAFGGWLARNFGGVDFIHLMMINKKVDQESIVAAVNALSPKKYDFDTLFGEYVKDCVNSEHFNIKHEGVADVNGKNYTLNPISTTPIVATVDGSVGVSVGSYGFVVREVEVAGSSCSFDLSARTSREKVHIVVK